MRLLRALSSWVLNIPKDGDAKPLWAFSLFDYPHSKKKHILASTWNFPCSSVCLLPLFCRCSSLRRVWLCLTCPLSSCIQWDLSLAFSLLKSEETKVPESPLVHPVLQPLNRLCGLPLKLLQWPSCKGEHKCGWNPPGMVSQVLNREK